MNIIAGVYQKSKKPGKFISGHSVRLLGWGVDKSSGVPYWLAANSWGKTWGENGFFRFLRGDNHCGIEDTIVAGLPNNAPEEFLKNMENNLFKFFCIILLFQLT